MKMGIFWDVFEYFRIFLSQVENVKKNRSDKTIFKTIKSQFKNRYFMDMSPPSYFESQSFSFTYKMVRDYFLLHVNHFFLLQVFCLFILPFHIFCTFISLVSFLHLPNFTYFA
ncbi:unnamed protein product [Meloidogyne enterolobii]|uniref:Uncharacterized protein n=1 Tax=Meloidogyne enterolobii TaxID=390850 RepID=A0ACB1AK78_MELEN